MFSRRRGLDSIDMIHDAVLIANTLDKLGVLNVVSRVCIVKFDVAHIFASWTNLSSQSDVGEEG